MALKTSGAQGIILSQNPPNHGARFGMKTHLTPFLASASFSGIDSKSSLSSAAEQEKVRALSVTRMLGRDLRLVNLLNAIRNVSADKSVTTSRCKALVAAHVKIAYVSLGLQVVMQDV